MKWLKDSEVAETGFEGDTATTLASVMDIMSYKIADNWYICVLLVAVVRHHWRVSLRRRLIYWGWRQLVLVLLLALNAVLDIRGAILVGRHLRRGWEISDVLGARIKALRVISALLACLPSFPQIRLVFSRHRTGTGHPVRITVI